MGLIRTSELVEQIHRCNYTVAPQTNRSWNQRETFAAYDTLLLGQPLGLIWLWSGPDASAGVRVMDGARRVAALQLLFSVDTPVASGAVLPPSEFMVQFHVADRLWRLRRGHGGSDRQSFTVEGPDLTPTGWIDVAPLLNVDKDAACRMTRDILDHLGGSERDRENYRYTLQDIRAIRDVVQHTCEFSGDTVEAAQLRERIGDG